MEERHVGVLFILWLILTFSIFFYFSFKIPLAMHEDEFNDLSDDFDYTISQHQGLEERVLGGDFGITSGFNEHEASKVVYSKDKVKIHPTQYGSERISGRLQLVKQEESVFMTWVPYKPCPDGNSSMEKKKIIKEVHRRTTDDDVRIQPKFH